MSTPNQKLFNQLYEEKLPKKNDIDKARDLLQLRDLLRDEQEAVRKYKNYQTNKSNTYEADLIGFILFQEEQHVKIIQRLIARKSK